MNIDDIINHMKRNGYINEDNENTLRKLRKNIGEASFMDYLEHINKLQNYELFPVEEIEL